MPELRLEIRSPEEADAATVDGLQ